MIKGVLLKGYGGFYYVYAEDRVWECSLRGRFRVKDQDFLPGDRVEILKEEVNVKEIKFGAKIESELELDMVITPELKKEGLLREVARAIQELRQVGGFEPKDKIEVTISAKGIIAETVFQNESFLKKEVNARVVRLGVPQKSKAKANTNLEGEEIEIGVR